MKKDKMRDYIPHYGFYDSLYNPLSTTGKERIKEIENLIKIYTDKRKGKGLDLCCGMGITTFALENIGFEATGVDIYNNYILRAKKYGKRLKSKALFFCMDVEDLKFEDESFDIVTMLGNPLPHFSIDSLSETFKEAFRVLKKDGEFIIEYNDFVKIMFSSYRWTLVEHNPENEVMISIHSGIDTISGYIKRYFRWKNEEFENKFYIWSPWIIEFLMKINGLKNINSYPTSEIHFITKGMKIFA